MYVNNHSVPALVDSGSAASFIDKSLSSQLHIPVFPSLVNITMASTSQEMKVNGKSYRDQKLLVLPHLCCQIILGRDFMTLHESKSI